MTHFHCMMNCGDYSKLIQLHWLRMAKGHNDTLNFSSSKKKKVNHTKWLLRIKFPSKTDAWWKCAVVKMIYPSLVCSLWVMQSHRIGDQPGSNTPLQESLVFYHFSRSKIPTRTRHDSPWRIPGATVTSLIQMSSSGISSPLIRTTTADKFSSHLLHSHEWTTNLLLAPTSIMYPDDDDSNRNIPGSKRATVLLNSPIRRLWIINAAFLT